MHLIPSQILSKKAELSANQAESPASQVHQMQLDHNAAMDSLKIQHREAMAALKHRHIKAFQSKNDLLKQYDNTIKGYEKMFTALLHEMKDKHVSRRQMERLNKKAAQTHANYLQHKVMYNALKDEVRDQQATSTELRQQLEEYEAPIDYLYDRLCFLL